MQEPRIRLRDLKGVHVNLQQQHLPSGYCYVAIWSLLKIESKQDEAVCLTVSSQASSERRPGASNYVGPAARLGLSQFVGVSLVDL